MSSEIGLKGDLAEQSHSDASLAHGDCKLGGIDKVESM